MGTSAKSSAELASGPRLPARYQLRRHIATGGMASVWCAEDLVLGRSVAVKVLSERFADDVMAVRRFQREARAAARVSGHPHVVTIFDVGDIEPSEDGLSYGDSPVARAFIVMEFLAGGTVADAIRVGAVRRPDAVRWLEQAASALDHAHQRGIVHRDIKPANFLLDNERVLHVADFGIARLQSEDTITSSGELFGTAAYLAPEQALGREATSATDRYSLAVAAFELLAGERPFAAVHFAAQARQHIEEEPPAASERDRQLPPGVDEVLIKGMAKQPSARFETAGAFVAALEGALDAGATARTRRLVPRRGAAAGAVPAGRPPNWTQRGRAGLGRPAAQRSRLTADRSRPAVDRSRPAMAAGRNGSSPLTASSSPRRSPRMMAFAALLAALGVVLVGVLSQTGSDTAHRGAARGARHVAATPRRPRHHPRATTGRASSSSRSSSSPSASTTASATTTTAAATSTTAASSSAAPSSAAGLQAQGHQELLAGNYSAAIPTLERSVSSTDRSNLTYAYALYDLGVALLRSGNPTAAIPVLEQRLQIPNQTGVVQQTLNQARQAAGRGTTPASTAPQGGATGPGQGTGHGSGGAGLPGHDKHHGRGNGGGGGAGGD